MKTACPSSLALARHNAESGRPRRVAVAVSGGVDSLCALLLLRRAGHELVALHGLFTPATPGMPATSGTPGTPAIPFVDAAAFVDSAPLPPPAADPLPGLKAACAALDVPLHVLDLRAFFARQVIGPFVRAYAQGRTPNPCALCNQAVKFGALLDAALALGADHLATGHYARLLPADQAQGPDALPLLAAAHDAAKDQSYFLSLVPQARLGLALFPLAARCKAENRAEVAAAGLAVPLPQESQDICFVPPVGAKSEESMACRAFLDSQWQHWGLKSPGQGPVLLCEGEGKMRPLGRHQGLWRYTEGQRRGLGIAHSEPLYVLGKNVQANALLVGGRHLLGMTACMTENGNIFVPPALWPTQVLARLRHRQKPAPATVRLEDGRLHIRLESPQFPSAPGQVAALYDHEGRVLAGAVVAQICSRER